ncbi:MAG: BamA/TamA family outer membrane protein [Gemmatimonadetes bacterium]|nr:BamA/TamA family outer membrane protein [Gemmatimonadota bacterium]MBT5059805.1 BamA/TamA family outer membrane protein [Gemmatimonadota bacterium]MBT5146597.1 BamA/TamA family outer membrane protein [Gemmatimonadota bacterium]MBT5587247.1 BamA/TamA family outer membrane protein [Gemmatimonadota bacterium]MBT5961339.1 BamA/TamA family outer membrane protein [Gemmatimonadota bacterium]
MTHSQQVAPGAVRAAIVTWGFLVAIQLTVAPASAFTGHALGLQGSGHVEIDDSPLLHGSDGLTLSAWFRVDQLRGWQALMWKGDMPDRHPWYNREFGLFIEESGYVHLCSTPVSRQRRGQLYVNTPGGTIRPGQWFHVTAVVSSDAKGGVMRIYVNGELSASRPYDRSGLKNSTGPLWLGGIPQTGAGFHGMIDDVKIWRRALAGEEVRQQMHGQMTTTSGLMAHYTFDQVDLQGDLVDQSGHRHRGHLVGDAHLRTLQVAVPPVATVAFPVATPLAYGGVPATTTTTTTTMRADESTTTTTTTSPTTPVVPVVSAPLYATVPLVSIPIATVPQVTMPQATVRVEPIKQEPESIAWIDADGAYLLLKALRNDDSGTRRRAADAFDRLSPEVESQVLSVALRSDDAIVRRRAASALEGVDPDNFRSLAELALASDDVLVRREAADALDRRSYAVGSGGAIDIAKPLLSASTASTFRPQRYSGWAQKWSAQRPDVWDDPPEGLLAKYNRVDGVGLGWRLPQRYDNYQGLAHFGELMYGFDSEQWRYQVGGEVFTFYGPPHHGAHLAAFGIEAHDLTDTQDGWLLSEEENSLAAALLRRDYYDHFRRVGGSLYSAHNIGGVLQVTGRYARDDFESLEQISEWSLFGDRWGEASFAANPQIDEGIIASLRLDVQLDTRDETSSPNRGWLINGLAERSGGFLEGDHTFKRYLIDLRRYQPVGRGSRFDLRLRGATAKGRMPSQYRYRIGGLGSVRGYDDKAFAGDRVALLNAQYWLDMDQHWGSGLPVDGVGLGVFFDAGAVWSAQNLSDPFEGFEQLTSEGDFKRSVGLSLGSSDGSVRFDFARPLDKGPDGQEDGWRMLARISRTF